MSKCVKWVQCNGEGMFVTTFMPGPGGGANEGLWSYMISQLLSL